MSDVTLTRNTLDCFPVILAGGSGTRLWPLSRTDYPKQFLALGGTHTLLQETALRLGARASRSPIVVCAERHRFLTAEQLLAVDIDDATILLESAARNTAPAIAVAAWQVLQADPDGVMVVMPADHKITDSEAFASTIEKALVAARSEHLVTLGITPDYPEIGYGYIQSSSGSQQATAGEASPVKSFIEKPDADHAARLIAAGDCYWNAGVFVFKAANYLKVLEQLKPEIHRYSQQATQQATRDLDFIRLDNTAFAACEDVSVDYAVLEKADNVVVLPYTGAWSDIGSWDAVHRSAELDDNGNASVGDVLMQDCTNTYAHAEDRLVVTKGLTNVAVIETSDAVTVVDTANSQGVREIVTSLKARDRTELTTHRTVYRPWGQYTSLNIDTRFQVKRITVKPGEKLSLQKHFHRSEHWIVVHGTAIVTVGEQEFLLSENESTYIPLGSMHRLFNPGSIPLELIEVQSGSYLGEDDIVRVGDEYGRS